MWCLVMGAVALASEVEVRDEDSSAPSSVPLNVTPNRVSIGQCGHSTRGQSQTSLRVYHSV